VPFEEPPSSEERERRLRSLRAVAEHLQSAPSQAAGIPQRSAAEHPSPQTPLAKRFRWGGIGLALAFLLGKFKFVLMALKFAKFGTLLSMIVAVWAYAMLWGLPFALGFVLLIFVHEMGHALTMRHLGVPAGAPVFIPFVGAVIAMKKMPRDAYIESLVGIGGPALGSLGAFVCFVIGQLTGSLFWYALAHTGFLINLFNMIPISPLDGGRIVGVISRWFWLVGYAVGGLVFWKTHSPILFLILLLGLFSIGRTVRGPSPEYFAVASDKRLTMGVAYFGLLALLAMGMWVSQEALDGVLG
jgi:Zn-dependent protease